MRQFSRSVHLSNAARRDIWMETAADQGVRAVPAMWAEPTPEVRIAPRTPGLIIL